MTHGTHGRRDGRADAQTVKIFWPHAGMPEHYRGCTNLDTDVNELTFTDSAGKQHQVFGLPYEVLEE